MTEAAAGRAYCGRFAPSPTGPLHAGSLLAALASYLDARAHGGRWLVRIEDVDTPRCRPEHGHTILAQLAACGLHSDGPVLWQSQRTASYQAALDDLRARHLAYGCACSRQDIARHWQAQGRAFARHQAQPYPGTCRAGTAGRAVRAWRLLTQGHNAVEWTDRRLGAQQQSVEAEVGDFILRRADGCWAYQLAVVVDDAEQGITDVVRGEDLADNTARQIVLQEALGLPRPRYWHGPLVCDARGDKLSKQHGAPAIDTTHPMQALNSAAARLGLPISAADQPSAALASWVDAWRRRHAPS